MRIGIFLGDFNPDVGGGFTFQDDLFRAFAKISEQSAHQFVVLGSATNLQDYVTSVSDANNLQAAHISVSWVDTRLEALKTYSPLLRKLLRRLGPIERTANELDLDCLWYVGGGAYESTDIPYIATVWDLQHQLTPWFPEMSAKGTWDARELSYRRFLQRASYVITGTAVGRDEIRLCYQVPSERICLLPHPTPGFALAGGVGRETGITKRLSLPAAYLLYPAQFWPHKNHINLLHALKILRSRHGLTVPLVLAGSEKGNTSYVKQVAATLSLDQQIFFTGFVTQDELVDLYCGASMLVYASLCGPENLPPLEAFALSCPVAAAEVPGAGEQLGNAALFFKPTDPEDIAEKIMILYTDHELRTHLQKLGLQRAKEWTAQDFARGMLEIFDQFSIIRRCWPSGASF